MTEPQLAKKQTMTKQSKRGLLLGTGIALVLIGLYISAFLVPDVIQTAVGPETVTLDEAADIASSTRSFVRIEGGEWVCETLREVRGVSVSSLRYGSGGARDVTQYTEVFFSDDRGEVIVFVTLSGEVDCGDLAEQLPTGYLYAMNDDTRQELTNDARLARFIAAESFLEFCGYCGQKNSLIGAAFGVSFLLLGSGVLYARHRSA
jgi:hypothetical protein